MWIEKSKRRIRRSKHRGLLIMTFLMFGWFVVSYSFNYRTDQTENQFEPNWQPRFLANLERLDRRELDVLPSVGQQTANKWIIELDQADRATFTTPADIEQLSGVGPVRSEKLAPYLIESTDRNRTSLNVDGSSDRSPNNEALVKETKPKAKPKKRKPNSDKGTVERALGREETETNGEESDKLDRR